VVLGVDGIADFNALHSVKSKTAPAKASQHY
jgi:hypothetical protein